MKTFILALLPLVLTGCTITKQAQVSEIEVHAEHLFGNGEDQLWELACLR